MSASPENAMDEGAEIVVAGGGTAGCVVAGRLAEAGRDVLMLEAGPDHGRFLDGRWPADLLDARTLAVSHDWGYRGRGVSGQPLVFERARVVGGCSAHNGCTQMVGWGRDYDGWEMSGWRADELRPLFDAARERMRIRDWEPDEIQPFQRAFVDGAAGMGLPRRQDLDDLNAGISVGAAAVNIVDGVRWNASFAYLDPVRGSGRLRVVGRTVVDRVVIDHGRAVAVETWRKGVRSTVAAERVVVSAGAYGTPGILMRSGVGPAEVLRGLGLEVVADVPGVGANLHDHPSAQLEFEGTEALANDLAAFARTRWLPEEQTTAKIASAVSDAPYDLHVFPWVERDESSDSGWKVVIPVALVAPRSRGEVSLRAADPTAVPDIDHGYLREPEDVRALVDGVRWCLELIRSAPQLAPYLGSARSIPEADDDETMRSWVLRTHQHYWHPVGSARMGGNDDPAAVVDQTGAVRGVSGLFVADASVFPQVPRSTPAWPVVVAGERVARALIDAIGS